MDQVNVSGIGGQITLTNKRVIIKRNGVLGTLGHGLKGNKEIPIKNITAVQFKRPGSLTNGYIQFTILGGVESRGGIMDATGDENTVLFDNKQESDFLEIKRYIDSQIDDEPILLESLNIKSSMNSDESFVSSGESPKSLLVASLLSLFFGSLGIDS
jgi:hypothetical protein